MRKSWQHRDRYRLECDIFRELWIQRQWTLLKKWVQWFRVSKRRWGGGGTRVTGPNKEARLMSVSWQLRRGLNIQPGQTTITTGCSEAYLAVTLRQRPANSPLSGIRIRPTRVTSEAQRAASSSFICLHNAAKDSGLHRGGAALLTGPAAPLRPSGLVVKRSLEKNCGWNTLARLCPVCRTGWIVLTLALCQPDPVKPLNKSHSSVVLYMPNGWHSSSRVVL